MKPHRPYELQEYDPAWKQKFLMTAEKLRPVFGDNLVEVEHIGSTSIEGMVAKPQIDIIVVVKDLGLVRNCYEELATLGFVSRGRGYVAEDDEYFTEDSFSGTRLTSVHIFQVDNPKIPEYKIFRDYLRENKEDRELYIATKTNLYSLHRDNYAEYDGGKKDVILTIKARAKQWASEK